jgi:hypothetical protein
LPDFFIELRSNCAAGIGAIGAREKFKAVVHAHKKLVAEPGFFTEYEMLVSVFF